jgi:hypothetical protein
MKLLRRFSSSWKTLTAGILAIIGYLLLPRLIKMYDPTAGLFDAGYLQWIGLASVVYFWAIFLGWIGFQIAFASLDKDSANEKNEWGSLRMWFDAMTPAQKWCAVQGCFTLCLVIFLICLKLVPVN